MSGVKSPRLKKMLKATTVDHRITPRLLRHLLSDDNSSLVDTKLALELMRLAKERPLNLQGGQDRSAHWHPSQLDGCKRAQVFQYLGVPVKARQHSPELINIFNDGTWRHMRWQITLLRAGIITRAEVPVWCPEWNMTGHIDGENEPEEWALELKGTSQFAQIRMYGVPPHHKRQMHGYFVGRPDLKAFVYLAEDKTTNQWEEIIVYPEQSVLDQTKAILHDLQEAVDNHVLPPILEECEYGQGEWKQCAYAYLCKQVGWDETQDAVGCADNEAVIVKLDLKRSNKHKDSTDRDRRKAKSRANELGTAEVVGAKSGTLRVRRGVDG
jgi:hypothetical protein